MFLIDISPPSPPAKVGGSTRPGLPRSFEIVRYAIISKDLTAVIKAWNGRPMPASQRILLIYAR